MRRTHGWQGINPKAAVCACVAAVFVALTWPTSGPAQTARPGDVGTLGTLLRQLRDLRGVDDTRRRARPLTREELLGALGPESRAAKAVGVETDLLSESEITLLLRRFCLDDLSDEPAEQTLLEEAILAAKFSRLEQDYCRRAAELLRQFGYDAFAAEIEPTEFAVGAIPSDYVLGIGDELAVNFHGQEPEFLAVEIDREGLLIVPGLPPIPAAGRRFGELRRELEAITARTKLGTEVFVSLARVRAIRVLVVGEVSRPGLHLLTGLSNVIDALRAAGGVSKTGSLRRVQMRRGGRIIWVDLYDLYFDSGLSYQLGVADGDQITVPAIGATVAVAGDVKRPGIYEFAEGRRAGSMQQVLAFAGGPLRPRGNDVIQISFADSGGELVSERAANDPASIGDGDIVIVQRRRDIQSGTVALGGHVRVPGKRSLARVKTVRGLLTSAAALKEDPYLPFAVLETSDPATQARRLFAVNLQRILAGGQDYALRDFDRLIVLGADDIRFLSSPAVQEIVISRELEQVFPEFAGDVEDGDAADKASLGRRGRSDKKRSVRSEKKLTGRLAEQRLADLQQERGQRFEQLPPEEEVCAGLQRLAAVVAGSRTGRYSNALRIQDVVPADLPSTELPCPKVFDDFGEILPFALEHVVAVNGEVRRPGVYPVADDTPLASIIAVAGGLTREVDLTRLVISRFNPEPYKGLSDTVRRTVDLNAEPIESVSIKPGDVVRFNPVFTDRDSGPVVLLGEFVRPGVYEIRRGEMLSNVMRRAGGLTEQGYAYGAIFLRERVRRAEQLGFVRAARELNASLAAVAIRRGVSAAALGALRQIARDLGDVPALGRVVIEADPTVLQVRPELDSVLEPGDRIFVPKRPNFVSVIGDVLNPGALQFTAGTTADTYIEQAGGFQRSADEGRTFVVFPNGRAQPLSLSAWNFSPVQIPPGSTIVSPKDPVPFDLLTFSRDITDLISKVAITAASLAVISRN